MNAVRVRQNHWKLAVIAGGVILAAAAIAGLSRKEESVEVWSAPAVYGDLSQQVTTNGTVIPTHEFQARANFPGIVEKVYVELGNKVKPGQMLVSMRDPFAVSRVAAANSTLQAAQVGNENLKKGGSQEERIALNGDLEHGKQYQADSARGLAALKELQKKGAASAAEVAGAEQRMESANTSLETLRQRSIRRFSPRDLRNAAAHVADAQASLDAAKIQFANAHIASPMAGTVYAIQVTSYDFVPMGADLLRVADLNAVEIRAYFDEPEIGKLIAGQPVAISWDGRPGRTWHGHIKQAPVAAMALGPRSVGECIIAVDDSKEDLLPNTNVIVTVTIRHHEHVLTIPRAALHADGAASYVYRVDAGRLSRTPVDTGIVNLDRAEIRRGLSDGETVALNAVDNRELRDGLPVRSAHAESPPSGISGWLRMRVLHPGKK